MADQKISELTAGAPAVGTDLLVVARGGTNVSLTLTNLNALYQPLDADLTTWAGLTPSLNAQSLVTAADYAAMRALLDLESGTDFLSPSALAAAYQPLDADLTSIAALTTTSFGRSLLELADQPALLSAAGAAAASHAHAAGDITSGVLAIARGGLGVDLSTAPGADRLLFWDHSALAFAYLSAGSGLTITGTEITAAGGIGGSVGTVDGTIPRADGIGGVTLQSSGLKIDDTDALVLQDGPYLRSLDSNNILLFSPDPNVFISATDGYSNPFIRMGAVANQGFGTDGVALRSTGKFSFATGTDPYISDTHIERAAAGTTRFLSTAGVSGRVLFSILVEANTAGSGAPNVLAATESGSFYTNTGSTAINVHDLPPPANGLHYGFNVTDADGIRVNATNGATIRYAATQSAADGKIESTTIGDVWWLIYNGVEWMAYGDTGAGIAVT